MRQVNNFQISLRKFGKLTHINCRNMLLATQDVLVHTQLWIEIKKKIASKIEKTYLIKMYWTIKI